jgi:serine/threonine protein kinase
MLSPKVMTGQPTAAAAGTFASNDVYATGCVAYWLLTGQLVFTAGTAMALLMHHAHTAPTPPSARTELAIPPAMEQLVLACLAKDPAARPQSAKELSRLLLEVDGGVWTGDHARDWWTRHLPMQAPPGTSRADA